MNKDLDIGEKIRDKVFKGNIYSQFAKLREVITILIHKMDLQDDEDLNKYLEINTEIETILMTEYPEEWEENE